MTHHFVSLTLTETSFMAKLLLDEYCLRELSDKVFAR